MAELLYNLDDAANTIGIDNATMLMLIGMLVTSFDTDIKAIELAVNSNNHQDMHSSSHRLKGAAANLGFTQLAEVCLSIESSAKQKEDVDYNAKLADVIEHAELIKTWHAAQS